MRRGRRRRKESELDKAVRIADKEREQSAELLGYPNNATTKRRRLTVVEKQHRNDELQRRLADKPVALVQDGVVATIEEAYVLKRRERRADRRESYLPVDRVCPVCGKYKESSKQWVVLTGPQATRNLDRLLVDVFYFNVGLSRVTAPSVCRSCWEIHKVAVEKTLT